jgi:hypothetical protein
MKIFFSLVFLFITSLFMSGCKAVNEMSSDTITTILNKLEGTIVSGYNSAYDILSKQVTLYLVESIIGIIFTLSIGITICYLIYKYRISWSKQREENIKTSWKKFYYKQYSEYTKEEHDERVAYQVNKEYCNSGSTEWWVALWTTVIFTGGITICLLLQSLQLIINPGYSMIDILLKTLK